MYTNEAPVMRFKSLFVVVWFSVVLPNLVSGQVPDVTLERVVGREPLQGKLVQCCLEDHLGYLWVGTDEGLNRYDGYGFTTFTHDPKVEGSLSHSSVLSLYEDRQGTLWVGTRAGLNKFDRRTRAFTHFQPDPTSLGPWGNMIAGLREDSKGILWVVGGGIRTFDRITGEFTLIRHEGSSPESSRSYKCHAILEDDAGTLWIATSWGLDCYNREKGTMRHFWVDEGALRGEEPDVYGYHFIQNMFKDHTGKLWLCTDAGPVAFDRSSGKFKPYAINRDMSFSSSGHSLSSMCEDDMGRLWIGVWGGGLMAYDAKADSFVALRLSKSMVPFTGVGSLYKDVAGTIWIGTSSDGLWKMVRPEKGLTSYTHDPNNPNSLSNPDVAFFIEAKPGVIGAVSGVGVDHLDRRTGAFYELVPFERLERPYSLTGWLRSRTGHVYTGVTDGFNVIQEKPYRRRHISTFDQGLEGFACSLFEDRRGIIWMLTSDAGVCQFDPGTEKFKKLGIGGTQPYVTSHMIMEDSLSERPDGWALWIGTQDGLWRFDARSETYTHFSQDPRDPASISSNSITTLLRDHNHTLWVGTDQGLNRMDSAGGRFTCFGEAEGLSERRVLGILEDVHGRLWVSTRSMLSRFDPQTNQFNSYGMNQVIKNFHFVPGCCLRSSTGEMYFGGQGGFVLFNPDSIVDNPHIPQVVLTGFKKFDTPLSLDSAMGGENTIELSYKDVAFSFEYVALDFTSPEDNQYAYKLEGYDLNWKYVGNRQVARYMNVEPGHYTFRVKGSNNDGIWNEEGTSIALVIAPPVWKTTWAYMGYALIGILLLYSSRRYEMNRLRLKHQVELRDVETKKLKQVDEMKSHFFANISHEFRTPLTLILGPIEKLRSKFTDEEALHDLGMMKRNAHQLLRLINQLLDLSKLEAGGMKLHASRANIVPVVRGIANSFESLAALRRIDLQVSGEQDEIQVYFEKGKLDQILTNLLSNAFKFTPDGGKVKVAMRLAPSRTPPISRSAGESLRGDDREMKGQWGEVVEITISDTGIGIPADKLSHVFDRFYQVDDSTTREQGGTGIGLALVRELVELHYGTIRVTSQPGVDTGFIVSLPLGKEHLKYAEIVDWTGNEEIEESLPEAIAEGPVPVPEAQAILDRDVHQYLVLIVEDNAEVRQYIRDNLPSSYSVIEARDGAEGIDKAKETIPELIISDVMMPKKDGYELCRTLKNDEKTSHIPIILLTAKAASENKIEGLETGADDYLIKPFEPKELVARVKNLIDLRRRLRERFKAAVPLKIGEVAVTSIDDAFLKKVMGIVEERLGNEAFSVEDLAGEAGMSRSQLHRKMTALTGQSPSDFIRYMRLHRAMELLKKNAGTVSEIAYTVGFSGVSYFTKCFREQFQLLPSEVKRA